MTIIEAINKAIDGDKIYNPGSEPYCDLTINVTKNPDFFGHLFDTNTDSECLMWLNDYHKRFLFSDKWEIHRKKEEKIITFSCSEFLLKINDYHFEDPSIWFELNFKPHNPDFFLKWSSQKAVGQTKLELVFTEGSEKEIIK